MNKAKVTITFNVCDDFEAGKCPECPYQTRTYFENHYIPETIRCLLGYTNLTCPVEILEKEGYCKTCRYRDPEDKKCDYGGLERQGCQFPVSDDYFCKFYEKGGEE